MRIIVTGASRGIGFELVKQYAELGHEVLAISRNATKLKQLKEECFHLNPNALVYTVDFDLTTDDFKTRDSALTNTECLIFSRSSKTIMKSFSF